MTDFDPRPNPIGAGLAGAGNPFGMGDCGAEQVERGQPVPEALLAQARAHPGQVRIVRRGQAMTMDLRPDRLTIMVDDDGRVIAARCG
ncbi:I78 family peptidase inhibitor [Sphingomonas sp. Leaf10]|uniref:I78 family peptidase inhibitor n=1 Tax=Sphingomonas sp. Leaf10 TaxID=1735676 RepID=UPI0006F9DAC0|nr:I78 family peptidase inhibitor [Sphingomonas sp. Leaf10]KQM30087.1 hypothetical protein ASE59_09365 [Sphingomonas sp. Leaf10]